MNEEVLKNAKFYLQRYAERVSDDIQTIKYNIENYEKVSGQKCRMDENYRMEIIEKTRVSKERLESKQIAIKEIDELVKYLSTFIKK